MSAVAIAAIAVHAVDEFCVECSAVDEFCVDGNACCELWVRCSAVDEIYHLCETDENVEESQEVCLVSGPCSSGCSQHIPVSLIRVRFRTNWA